MDSFIANHVLSSFLHFLEFLVLFLSVTAEVYIFMYRRSPAYHLFPLLFMFLLLILRRLLTKPTAHIYLVDFSCLKPPGTCRVPTCALLEHLSLIGCFDKESVVFMAKVITSSGLGEETYLPPPLHYIPPEARHHDSIAEAEMLLFPVLDDLFSKTSISPRGIDVLVLNCSGFCPSPSLCSIVINRYAMREDIKSYNLSGMGCSAGAVGIDITRSLLRTNRASYAVVISTEIVSTGWYSGKDRRKLLLNCLFRMGASAVLLTNKNVAKKSSNKYKLVHLVRTQRAFDDRSYRSAMREEDSEGVTGFSIERDLLQVAGETLRSNAAIVGSLILPFREKLRYLALKLWKGCFTGSTERAPVPDFGTVISHYCLPASGKAVIGEIGRGLRMGRRETEAAMATFHRFGNQSAASMWYQLAYMEAKGRVKKGDKVWQLAMGSGPKCNSLLWECVTEMEDEAEKGPWADCIHRYPREDSAPLPPPVGS